MRSHPLALLLLAGCARLLATIELRVVDPQGASIPGAHVFTPTQTYVTDLEGLVYLNEPAPLEIRITASGFTPRTVRVERDRQSVSVVLQPEVIYSSVEVVVKEAPGVGPVVARAVEIERTGARTVLDAVDRLLPGAHVTRRGVMGYGIASGGTGVVTVRGVGNTPNTGVLIVVDDRPDYMGLMGHPLPDFYSLTDAAAVRVIQGPASVLYGSNAMGGVIEVQPSDPGLGRHTELLTSLGSFWTGQHRLRHGQGFARGFYQLTAGLEHTSGHRPSADFRNRDATLALGRDLGERWKTALRGRFGHFHVEDPGTVRSPKQNSYARVGRGGFSWGLDNQLNRTWGHARVFSSWGHHWITDGWRSNDRTTGGRWHQHWWVSSRLVVDGGFDVVDFGGRGRNIVQRRDYGEHRVTAGAGFWRVQGSIQENWRWNAGLRYEHNSVFGGITVPEVGTVIRLAPGYSLHLAVARGFRNPTIRELYLFPAPNPNLRPEHLWNYQGTLELHPKPELAASITGYYADLSNLIVTVGRWPAIQLQNAGAALNRGFEASARWRWSRRVALYGGYAYLRSTNLPPYVPRHKGVYSMEFDLRRAFVHVGGVTVGRRWADTTARSELDPYTVLSFKLMIPWGRATWFVDVDNFTDTRYEVVTGYPMPGVNAAGGLVVRF